ncbi:hypothetical protein H2199_003027 [Coniosporium tulheliwenetii]|uniref:Uncharacterized protein n=1 Tax=Coniosporium tulheliwenetii TaxID=3383036 RepID=A0ACC2ZF96_9PEZI|nr:hypothetical protein H2199_003027 [Cladosporium sp. JES 115]
MEPPVVDDGGHEEKDQSMNVAINAIRRLEYKVEHLTALVASQHETLSIRAVDQNDTGGQNAHALQSPVSDSTYAIQEADPAALSSLEGFPSGPKPISFSQHRVLFWPAIRPMLPRSLKYACKDLTRDYVIDLENHRPTLDMSIQPHPRDAGDAWLKELPASTINGLSTAFFSTFNRLMPALNRSSFTKSILGAALANDFGHQIETCLALVVMALGCLAVRGYEEGDYPLPVTPAPDFRPAANKLGSEGHFKAPTWYAITQEDPPGLRFFNEARRRFGFLMCANNLESCQYYLLSALYHAQIIRPLDSWALINRAAVIILVILKSADSIDYDSEEGDMISRVYWNVLMYESILVQEMNLPSSDLLRYEDTVPLPKFTTSQRQPHAALSSDEDDSYFYYHFLAQATHRKLLTRIRNSLFFDSEERNRAVYRVVKELHHQLDQWRASLPDALQFNDSTQIRRQASPAHVIAEAMLRSRFLVAKFHIGRFFLHQVLHRPNQATTADYEECRQALRSAMYWPATTGICKPMKSCMLLKFGWCCQFFGQFLYFYAVSNSSDPRLREGLPPGWHIWWQEMLGHLDFCAGYSPAIAKDLELVRLLSPVE